MRGASDDNDTLIGGGNSGFNIGGAKGADIGEHQVKIIALIGVDERIAVAAGDVIGGDGEVRGNAGLDVGPPSAPVDEGSALSPFMSDPEAIIDGVGSDA